MTRWTTSIQLGDSPQLKVTQESAPWWVFVIESAWVRLMDYTPAFTVPLVGRIPVTIDGERYTVGSYYGDCPCCWMGCLFNGYSGFLYRRIRSLGEVSMPLNEAITRWGHDAPKWWLEHVANTEAVSK